MARTVCCTVWHFFLGYCKPGGVGIRRFRIRHRSDRNRDGRGARSSIHNKTDSRFLRRDLSQSKDRGLKSGSSKDKIVFSFDRANRFFYRRMCENSGLSSLFLAETVTIDVVATIGGVQLTAEFRSLNSDFQQSLKNSQIKRR